MTVGVGDNPQDRRSRSAMLATYEVSDYAMDGTDSRFAKFFKLLAGTEAFSLLKSDAWEDIEASRARRELCYTRD